jgi:hypothetical protein
MIKESNKPYKKSSKLNKKKKVIIDKIDSELVLHNNSKRFPIVSLPEIVPAPTMQLYKRFICATTGIAGIITIQDLLNQFMIAVTATTLYSTISCLRLKKIRALAPVTTQGTSVSLSMRPAGVDTTNNSFNTVPEQYTDTSASLDIPAYLSLTPSVMTPLGSWHFPITANFNLLTLNCPPGTTLDILFEFILRCSEPSASIYTRTVVGATIGQQYGSTILTNLIPTGNNSI